MVIASNYWSNNLLGMDTDEELSDYPDGQGYFIDKVPTFAGNWLGTCDPGEYYWENPMNKEGCADIKAWQYQAWSVGHHHGSTGDQLALVQTGDITVIQFGYS